MANEQRPTLNERGAWLREARIEAGYTVQADFARALDIDKSLLSNYETGKSRPSDGIAARIAIALQRPVIEVRRNLGMWVPDGDAGAAQDEREATLRRLAQTAEDLLAEVRRLEAAEAELERAEALIDESARLRSGDESLRKSS